MTSGRRLIAALVALSALAGCSLLPSAEPAEQSASNPTASAPTADLTPYYRQTVRWSRCGGRFQCTRVRVPLDYTDPGGAEVTLSVTRYRGRAGDAPLGSLVVNPGGPGVSGNDYARAARAIVTPAVLKAYDVVGFDPRGVMASEPVECVDDAQLDSLFAADTTPDDQAEVDLLARESAALGQGCRARSPQLAPHLDSVSVARDMDILRSVLGEERLNFLGKSYGTALGALYADLFPQHVGRFVLDGVLPVSLTSEDLAHGQAVAFEVALHRFVAWCIADADCPLPRDEQRGIARIQQLLDDLDGAPLPGIGDRLLTQALGTFAVLSHLYFPPSDWILLEYGLAAAFEGDGSVLLDMVDSRTDRNSHGKFTGNGNEAFYAVSCLDRPSLGGVDRARTLAADWAGDSTTFGPSMAWGTLPCWQWPLSPVVAAGRDPRSRTPVRASGAPPILLVSTRYDPATPYSWGVQVAEELESGHLLTYEGDGHAAYTDGSPCVDAAVDAYLLQGTLPAEGAACPAIPVGHGE